MKVTVIGATGHVGTYLVPLLEMTSSFDPRVSALRATPRRGDRPQPHRARMQQRETDR